MGSLFVFLFVALVFVTATSVIVVAQDANSCITNTLNGQVRGDYVVTDNGKGACRFYGIPFAKPPVNDLRFKRPVPIDNWTGIFNATTLPKMCTQNKTLEWETRNRNADSSEDCLYLNIWVPWSIFNSSTNAGAVMVWIHGGGFFAGSISEPLFNNPILAVENDVIVAFMQYRLGPLGSIYFGTEDVPGNMGIIDQSLALKWIYENINGFGGNNGAITLFGQSAGSMAVSLHALSPLSRPYFQRGILISGAIPGPILWRSKEAAITFSYEIAEHAGCYDPKEVPPKNVEEVIACLKVADKFLVTYGEYQPKDFMDIEAGFTIDDYFLLDSPDALLANPNNSVVDLMVGANADEGTSLLMQMYPRIFNKTLAPTFTYRAQEQFFRTMFETFPSYEQDAIITQYTNWENFNDVDANTHSICQGAGDFSIVCPTFDFGTKWSRNGPKVYSYWFTHIKENSFLCGDWMGACHGAELEYVFGLPLSTPGVDADLSRNIQTLFTNFAKTGNPSNNWTEYKVDAPVYLNLNGSIISDSSTNNLYGPRPFDCPFWNIELPRLRAYAEGNNNNTLPPNSASSMQATRFWILGFISVIWRLIKF